MCEFRVLRQTVQCSVILISPPTNSAFVTTEEGLLKQKVV